MIRKIFFTALYLRHLDFDNTSKKLLKEIDNKLTHLKHVLEPLENRSIQAYCSLGVGSLEETQDNSTEIRDTWYLF